MFELQPIEADRYRQQTRRIALSLTALFAVLGMLFSVLAVRLFGEEGGDNFRWNLLGVLAGLAVTVALVRLTLWPTAWMAPAVYGWQLKRALMRVTNLMHHVKAGVAARDPQALKLLRFYHLGLAQMHRLDGNLSELSQHVREIDGHRALLESLGIDAEQNRLDPAWLEAIKRFKP